MRNLGAGVLSFAIGIALGVPGLCLLIFLCLLPWQPELAAQWSRWVEAPSLLVLGHLPRQTLNGLSQGESLWGAWAMAAFLSYVGYSSLRGARDSFRPAGHSTGGLALVVIKTASPCVGAVLEGDLKLLKTPKPDQVFQVTLLCRHIDRSLEKTRESYVFGQSLDVTTARAPDGWHVPFRFDVPADAPPSTDLSVFLFGLPRDEYSWFIEFCPTDKWIVVPSKFQLTLRAAPVNAAGGD